MATKKITELVEIISAANDDVLPIVDISTDITNKIKVENLPISNDVQTALNGKENTIGYTTENVANKSTSVTTDQASNTKYPSVKAVYDWAVGLFATLSQLATKQDTLVSGTNIKTVNSTSLLGSGNVSVQETLVSGTNIRTINSTSLLGSGDISIQANPSGVSGAIQFSNGSAFASDATNLFWDNTNKRLGVGTSTPSATFHSVGAGRFQSLILGAASVTAISNTSQNVAINITNEGVGIGSFTTFSPTARLQVRGSGTTSATTALLVQNSSGSTAFQVKDDREVSTSGGNVSLRDGALFVSSNFITTYTQSIGFFGATVASAMVEMRSTTKGFLPPRMTTTEKNAISSPAAGLQVYDTTLNQMSYYNGTSWVNF